MINYNSIKLDGIEGKMLVFGGVYSNLNALKTMLSIIDEENIPDENVICTGDIVAYCAYPNEVCELLHNREFIFIKGNCEQALAEGNDNCGCGFGEGSSCDLLSKKWYEYSSSKLDKKFLSWFDSMADIIEFEYYGKKAIVFHGGIEGNNKFIFPSTSLAVKGKEMEKYPSDIYICGHSGLPFTDNIGNKLWHNAGVIGMPANDGTMDGFYTIISKKFNKISFTHHRLIYESFEEISKMVDVGLDIGYDKTLKSGIWPSFDILPEFEKSKTGEKIELDVAYLSLNHYPSLD